MPKVLSARLPKDATEAEQVHKLARSRHAPGDWIRRAQMIVRSWNGPRTTVIAAALGCHPQTVRERFVRFNAEGVDGLGDHPGAGRTPRLTEAERSTVLAMVAIPPPGRLVRNNGAELTAQDEEREAHWTLDALATAAQERGIQIGRSQVRRIFLTEGVRWRQPCSWTTSRDPDVSPKERRSSRCIPAHP
jgi:transposase